MRISRNKFVILVVMSIVGLAAASEVLFTYYILKGTLPFCTAGSVGGIAIDCDRVLNSSYSQIFGIPLEFFAVIYFIVNLGLVYMVSFGSAKLYGRALGTLFVWRFLGLMIVPYLVFIELFLLKAICVYCTIMHAAILADFIVISYFLFFRSSWLESIDSGPEPTIEGSSVP